MLKESTVVMLPTNQKAIGGEICKISPKSSDFGIVTKGAETFNGYCGNNEWVTLPLNNHPELMYHLYFLSDDVIQECDWCYTFDEPKYGIFLMNSSGLDVPLDFKKVIATTDPSLNLPSPSKAFIAKYCETGGIDKVMVEYEELMGDAGIIAYAFGEDGFIPKISKDNTITIRPIKETWTRDEILPMLDKVMNLGMSVRQAQLNGYGESGNEVLKTWIDDNL